jgi:hypothetical protein
MPVPQGTIAKPSATAARLPSIIVGARDPELLLRWELFDVLIDGAFSDDPATRADERRELSENASSAGLTLPPGFSDTLGQATRSQWEVENPNAAIGRRLQKAPPMKPWSCDANTNGTTTATSIFERRRSRVRRKRWPGVVRSFSLSGSRAAHCSDQTGWC